MQSTLELRTEFMHAATQLPLAKFMAHGLQEISGMMGDAPLLYCTVTARFGLHATYGHNIPDGVIDAIRAGWNESPITIPALERLGQTSDITDLMSREEAENNPIAKASYQQFRLYPRMLIVEPNLFTGLVDLMIGFDPEYAPIDDETRHAFRECHMAMRYGFSAALETTLKNHAPESAGVVDQHGHFYGASRAFRDHLATNHPDLIYLGSNAMFDPPYLQLNKLHMGGHFTRQPIDSALTLVSQHVPEILNLLSPREQQITNYLVAGYAYQAIGNELGISTSTVATLVHRVKEKTGANSRAAIIDLFKKD